MNAYLLSEACTNAFMDYRKRNAWEFSFVVMVINTIHNLMAPIADQKRELSADFISSSSGSLESIRLHIQSPQGVARKSASVVQPACYLLSSLVGVGKTR